MTKQNNNLTATMIKC